MSQAVRFLVCLIFGLGSFLPRTLVAEEPAKTIEQQWGDFSGQLIYNGVPPERKKIEITFKDFPETFDESLLVDAQSHGLANVFVYLRTPTDGKERWVVHHSVVEQRKQQVRLEATERGFSPHALCVLTNQELLFDHSKSKVVINHKGDFFRNSSLSGLLPPHASLPHIFSKPESLPAPVACNIHPWFSAYILVRDDPYMAVSDANGKFAIKNLPVGEHEFQFWHERVGYLPLPAMKLRKAEVAGTPKKGRTLVTIQPGANDLGEIKLEPKLFER